MDHCCLRPVFGRDVYLRHMGQFQGKKIWITGASSGIGKAAAQAFSAMGAQLLLSARRADVLQKVKEECAHPEHIEILPLDMEHHIQSDQWVTKALEHLGSIDLLISNAGIGQSGTVLETSHEVERKIFKVNYHGHVALAKSLLPHLIEKNTGHIVAIGSIAGKFGQRKLAAYSASKAALIVYFESLKEELKKTGIKVQVISPGFINTEVTLNSLDAQGNPLQRNSKAQENGMPADLFAQKLIGALESDRFHRYIGRKELLAVPLHALSPRLFYKLLG